MYSLQTTQSNSSDANSIWLRQPSHNFNKIFFSTLCNVFWVLLKSEFFPLYVNQMLWHVFEKSNGIVFFSLNHDQISCHISPTDIITDPPPYVTVGSTLSSFCLSSHIHSPLATKKFKFALICPQSICHCFNIESFFFFFFFCLKQSSLLIRLPPERLLDNIHSLSPADLSRFFTVESETGYCQEELHSAFYSEVVGHLGWCNG